MFFFFGWIVVQGGVECGGGGSKLKFQQKEVKYNIMAECFAFYRSNKQLALGCILGP